MAVTPDLPTAGMEDLIPTVGLSALEVLEDIFSDCNACEALCESRTNIVFGSGAYNARIMVIAEGPGEVEDREMVPMLGDAGRLLMDLLANAWPLCEEMEAIRNEDDEGVYFETLREYLDDFIFWTNVVLCRPANNRDPSPNEKRACKDRLHRVIYAVDPTFIIGVGKVAAGALMGSVVQITKKHGHIYDVSIESPVSGRKIRYPMLAILHPAFLLRKGDQDLVKSKKGSTYETLVELEEALELFQIHEDCALQEHFPRSEQDAQTTTTQR